PPLRAAARIGPRGVVFLARNGLPSVRRLAAVHFRGAGGPLLLSGNTLHADFTPDSPGGALFGFLLTALGQQHGFPVPEGGAGRLPDALVRPLAGAAGRAPSPSARAWTCSPRGRTTSSVAGFPTGRSSSWASTRRPIRRARRRARTPRGPTRTSRRARRSTSSTSRSGSKPRSSAS